jgi:hypothetical protein
LFFLLLLFVCFCVLFVIYVVQHFLEMKEQRLFSWFWRCYLSSRLASDMVSRAENIEKNKDQTHRLKGVLQDSILMLEQVCNFRPAVLRTFVPVWIGSSGYERIFTTPLFKEGFCILHIMYIATCVIFLTKWEHTRHTVGYTVFSVNIRFWRCLSACIHLHHSFSWSF